MPCGPHRARSRFCVPRSVCYGLLLAQAFALPGGAALLNDSSQIPPPRTSTGQPVPADTTRVYRLAEILITAPSPGMVAEPGRTEVPGPAIDATDAGSAEALAPLVPAARAVTNSRGETMFALRGASERQIALYQDGVALNIPWDSSLSSGYTDSRKRVERSWRVPDERASLT